MICRRLLHYKSVPRLYCNNVATIKNALDIPTHELLARANFIDHPKAGLVNWHPMGLTIYKKLESIIRKHMDSVGFEEVKLSLLSQADEWKQTGRWENTELFKLTDSSKTDFCLVPTSEEQITKLVSDNLNSYKLLPLLYYQINTKFRDEKRPRSGLLRGREFMMKDAYSFDVDEERAMQTYENVVTAYKNIYNDLKIPYVKAVASTGEIGGSMSHEWHYLHRHGEDTVFNCSSCGHVSNLEKTLSFPDNVDESKEVSVAYFTVEDRSTLVCVYYPTGRHLEPEFIMNEVPDLDIKDRNEEQILQEFADEDSLISKKIIRIMDSRLGSRSNFPDFPIKFINRSLITTLTDIPVVSAVEGEICGVCEDGKLEATNAIEVGHTFYLGNKYSSALNCSIDVPTEDGKSEIKDLSMGCYGIGLSRIIAATAEINKDENGLRWPAVIAPWVATIVKSPKLEVLPPDFFEILRDSGIDYRIDDRKKVGLGGKIKHSNLVGIPLAVVVGKEYPMIEIEMRGKTYSEVPYWKEKHQSKQFEWNYSFDENSGTFKHFVHKDNFVEVVNYLLRDM